MLPLNLNERLSWIHRVEAALPYFRKHKKLISDTFALNDNNVKKEIREKACSGYLCVCLCLTLWEMPEEQRWGTIRGG
jgi:hypothetical protein